nr:hypothetical protein Itr_chr14CG18150 [Ipomoea trifida]
MGKCLIAIGKGRKGRRQQLHRRQEAEAETGDETRSLPVSSVAALWSPVGTRQGAREELSQGGCWAVG